MDGREAAELSQAEVARRTGITRSSYRLYEAGKRSPNVPQLVAIARAFRVPLMRLVTEFERRLEAQGLTGPLGQSRSTES